MSTAGSWYN
nr:unnamed protein product [Callosobruchus analis]CAI5827420.1 unnamed protein product [Callosobruchus analis]CAI5827421.1 unnamed protein product [Callosobruchus analis]CAI5829689.1 unnamed protein product [Callosobruchus analis]CAI5834673.1 unnamed protein product [Callosobruchus analis]